jgi:ssDNA-binding Zn-finger/Zn-ribbon topoisomerase 1
MGDNEPLTSDELKAMACPRCGGRMEAGYVTGHWFMMRWNETNQTKTVFAGEKLRPKSDSAWSSPSIEAVRCPACKLGLFRYDY